MTTLSRRTIALTCLLLAWSGVVRAQSAADGGARVLVLPFENAGGEARLQWLGEASAVLVADGLKTRGVSPIGRDERVRAFEELHLPPSATLSRATVIKVAELLGARELIVGTFRVQDRELTIQAHAIRVDAGRARPSATERGQLTDLFELHDRLVRDLTPEASPTPTVALRPPLGAFESYVKGLLAASPAARATFLETALQDAPSFERARLALWEVRTNQGDHAAALTAIRGIPAASPLYARARFFAATSMLNLQRYDDAFETYGGLVAQAQGIEPALRGAASNNMGVIQIRRGGPSPAGTPIYFLTRATEQDPGAPNAFFNLGYAYVLDKNFQAAIYWLRETVRRDPTDADAHELLAIALQATGNAVEATRERDLARQLSAHYEELARSASPDRQGVARGLERVQLDPDGSGSLHATVIVGTSAQRDQRELATFHLERGRRLFEREQDTEALGELRKAVYLSPYEAQAHLLIGRIYLRAGRPADAVDALKISIWSADGAAAHVALAEAYLKTGNARGARSEVERALVLDPGSADAKRVLAQIK
jgi:tetratricopeptide (TPR) repeat protein/TolB-like protein